MSRSKPNRRRGAALIEFAICLPVFFLIAMATIETCRMVYLKQSLKISAYECARVAIIQGVTEEDIQAQCALILGGRNIKNFALTTVPDNFSSLNYGDLLTIRIDAPANENAIVGSWFYQGKTFSERVTIMVEY